MSTGLGASFFPSSFLSPSFPFGLSAPSFFSSFAASASLRGARGEGPTAVVVTLQQYLSDLVGGWVTAIIGAIFVACVLSFRSGVIGELLAWRARRARPAPP